MVVGTGGKRAVGMVGRRVQRAYTDGREGWCAGRRAERVRPVADIGEPRK